MGVKLTINKRLTMVAKELLVVMKELGIDHQDQEAVSSFINGCKIPQQLTRIIIDDLDEE